MKRGNFCNRKLSWHGLAEVLGNRLIEHLAAIATKEHALLYLTGGTVRDIVMSRQPTDIDLTVREGGRQSAASLCRLTGGTYVPLGKEEDAARVVWQGRDIDFSSFREGATTIEQELSRRISRSTAWQYPWILLDWPGSGLQRFSSLIRPADLRIWSGT